MDQNDINRLRGKTAVVGLAESGCGLASGWSAMEIMASAVHDALDDAGIKLKEVDGNKENILTINELKNLSKRYNLKFSFDNKLCYLKK